MRYTKSQLQQLADNGAFDDFADTFGQDSSVVEEAVLSGSVDLEDLEDFAWQDFLDE